MARRPSPLPIGRRRSRRPQIESANLRGLIRTRAVIAEQRHSWIPEIGFTPISGSLNAYVHHQFRTTSTEHLA